MNKNFQYDLVIENQLSTVVAEYKPQYRVEKSYQSEAELEQGFIKQLIEQGYEYLEIKNEQGLINNLRKKLEELNQITFTDNEWNHFLKSEIANPNHSIEEKTATIQEDYIKILERDDGSKKNIYLLDKKNIHNNKLQIINQYETESGKRPNRYDVTILVNGLPLVHIELKRRGIALKKDLTKSTVINLKVFGQVVDYLNMCKSLLFQMEPIPNIIAILQDGDI